MNRLSFFLSIFKNLSFSWSQVWNGIWWFTIDTINEIWKCFKRSNSRWRKNGNLKYICNRIRNWLQVSSYQRKIRVNFWEKPNYIRFKGKAKRSLTSSGKRNEYHIKRKLWVVNDECGNCCEDNDEIVYIG